MKTTTLIRWAMALVITAALFPSCEKEKDSFSDAYIIQSYIIPGDTTEVLVSSKVPYESGVSASDLDLDHLDVRIIFEDTSIVLRSEGEGLYRDTTGRINGTTGITYYLQVTTPSGVITASTEVPSKPVAFTADPISTSFEQRDLSSTGGGFDPGDDIVLSWTNADSGYYFVLVTSVDSSRVSTIADSVPDTYSFSSRTTNDDTLELRSMEFLWFGLHRVILYHIQAEYSTFFMNWVNNSQSYQEPPSNLENGLGIFTGVNADTLYIDVIQE